MMTNADALDMQCAVDGHLPGCPCYAGGDPIYRCYLCGRISDDTVLVDIDKGGPVAVCSTCWSRDEIRVPLDYTRDVP